MPRANPSEYDVHSSVAMIQSVVARITAKTGRSLEEWIDLVKRGGPPTEKERREWLMARHGLTTN